MAPEKPRAMAGRMAAALVLATCLTTPAHALRVINYNLLNYPGNSAPTRNPLFRTVLAPLHGDVLVAGEVQSQTGVNQFLDNVLNVMEPGQWAAAPFSDGNDTDGAFFYKPSKVQFLGAWSFYPNPANLLRLVHVYRVRPVGYGNNASDIRFYAVHLKASKGFEAQRAAEASGMRDSMNASPAGTHCVGIGDFNLYTSTEPALTRYTEVQADNDGRLYDPLNLGGTWQDNSSIAIHHTQSPCLSGGAVCASGAATGGMDDRFDLFLPTYNFKDGNGIELIPASYVSVGNDGLHLNKNIIDAPTIPEGATYADALIRTSDHLPMRVDLSLPAILAAAPSLDLGSVIAAGSADYPVSNSAIAPADGLTYTLAASSGFAAPAGTFEVAPGGISPPHAITTTAGPFGVRVGTLTIASDAPDATSYNVSLSANVLDHAAPSLDSLVVVPVDSLAFDGAAGSFTALDVRIHNVGFDPAQARLSVLSQDLAGPGAARFSVIDPGPALLSGVGRSYAVNFDDTGATPDQVYIAQLGIASADEPLPGATARPGLLVNLRAIVRSGITAVEDGLPAFSRLLAPFPNPLFGTSTVRFDLAVRGRTTLAVFDLSGRRVAQLVDSDFEPGHHTLRWSGTDDRGFEVVPGVYFIRMTSPDAKHSSARIAVIR